MRKQTIHKIWIFLALSVLVLAAACGNGGEATPNYTYPPDRATFPPMPTRTPVVETPTGQAPDEPVATDTAEVTATTAPSDTPSVVTATPLVVTPTTPAGRQRVKIFLVAVGDNGENGKKFGCDDSLIPVEVVIEPTVAVLRASLTELLSIDEQYYGQSGLYNALYQSDLAIDRLGLQNGVASVYLTGDLVLGGVCDNPRVKEQLEATALQFSTVNSVQVFINDEPLDEVLSLQD